MVLKMNKNFSNRGKLACVIIISVCVVVYIQQSLLNLIVVAVTFSVAHHPQINRSSNCQFFLIVFGTLLQKQ